MSTISTEELYYGEKYHVFGRVCEELLTTRKPDDYGAQTWLELLLVNHAAIVNAEEFVCRSHHVDLVGLALGAFLVHEQINRLVLR